MKKNLHEIDAENTAIYAEHVSKRYRIGVIGSTTLKAELQTKWAKFRGKEDPNARIGARRIENGFIEAVDDVSFSVKKGECLGIIGRNGAGKSTLLKLICRVTTPSEGVIACNGQVTSMLEVGTGFNGELTGRENIYLNGSILGMTKEEIDKKLDDIIEFSEVGDFIDTPVKRYSSGMYVKLAFSVSAHLNADIVIMDEVLAVGDVQFQNKCIRRMREIATNEGKTVLYVSHNMNTIHALCDRCLVLDEGKIVYDGDVSRAEQIYRNETGELDNKDYSDGSHRRYNRGTGDIKIQEVSYTEENGNMVDDTLSIKLRWLCVTDVDDLIFRIEVRDAIGKIIGSKIFADVPRGKAGEEKESEFVTDVRVLQNGFYTTTYVFQRLMDNKTAVTLDIVDGLSFMIDDPDRESLINWRSDWWGKVRL